MKGLASAVAGVEDASRRPATLRWEDMWRLAAVHGEFPGRFPARLESCVVGGSSGFFWRGRATQLLIFFQRACGMRLGRTRQ
jgi:hypothetical protein